MESTDDASTTSALHTLESFDDSADDDDSEGPAASQGKASDGDRGESIV